MLRRRLAAALLVAALGTSLAACDRDREGGTQPPPPGAEDPSANDGPNGGNPANGGTDNGSGTGSGRGTP